MFPREGGDPVWAPTFAGEQDAHDASGIARTPCHHPGEGRGPVGKVAVTADSAPLSPSLNWAPAFAGVDVFVLFTVSAKLFPREGGDPVWAPAFAGEQAP